MVTLVAMAVGREDDRWLQFEIEENEARKAELDLISKSPKDEFESRRTRGLNKKKTQKQPGSNGEGVDDI